MFSFRMVFVFFCDLGRRVFVFDGEAVALLEKECVLN